MLLRGREEISNRRTEMPPAASGPGDPGKTIDRGATVVLVMDAAACIHYCSSPAALGRRAEELAGRCIRDLMPDLPLKPRTPGYNFAYAKFWFGRGQWQHHSLVMPDGRRSDCELQLLPLFVAKRGVLVADLRLPHRTSASSGRNDQVSEGSRTGGRETWWQGPEIL